MQLLLSLPENLTTQINDLGQFKKSPAFTASDPPGTKVGSGGGTAWLLARHYAASGLKSFDDYLASEKKVIIHAGGQGRRLPAYAPSGKILTPIPVFRWSRGQRLDQNLMDLQLPLYERLMQLSGSESNTLIASGDVFIQFDHLPHTLPDADVICLGIWADPHSASHHGVFFSKRTSPDKLDFMLQKPSHSDIEKLTATHLYMMDAGVWILSNRAINILMKKCDWTGQGFNNGIPDFYDLYTSFGACLGEAPLEKDPEGATLTTAVISPDDGAFFHYGTSLDLINSTEKIQNSIKDQRNIWHNRVKPHPSLFVQNAISDIKWSSAHHHIWVENSHLPASWKLSDHHVITGIFKNNWQLQLPPGTCIDMVPVENDNYALRPYGIHDRFAGHPADPASLWLGQPVLNWLKKRGINLTDSGLGGCTDLQQAPLFPVLRKEKMSEGLIQWMISGLEDDASKKMWLEAPRISAEQINQCADLTKLYAQRQYFYRHNLRALAANYKYSVFYQTDLKHAAAGFVSGDLELPEPLPHDEQPMLRFRDAMFRSEIMLNRGLDGTREAADAFEILKETIVHSVPHHENPRLNVFPDQIVWARSPARLDLAGGWSDTPPYCLQSGGSVVNMAVDLNGQPPLQVFIRLSQQPQIVLRSIDNGVSEVIDTFSALRNEAAIESAFSIPRAALCLAGFHPDYCRRSFSSLKEQLVAFGGGIEISLLAAIPKGSGLGTSSILAATILGALADFCALPWDQQAICHRTLILEQMLTTGGGWQDQYGGILPGIKLLETAPGTQESMRVRWLPDLLFTQPATKNNWLLYYTGITRVAKNILSEIVRGMFLNEGRRLGILNQIKAHAGSMFDAIQQCNFEQTGKMIGRSWDLNRALDPGTNTPQVQSIIDRVNDYTYGLKLLGAGGGGYMLMCARDEASAAKIKTLLTTTPPNNKARFVEMTLNTRGFEISRS